jgi:LysM repeat protein
MSSGSPARWLAPAALLAALLAVLLIVTGSTGGDEERASATTPTGTERRESGRTSTSRTGTGTGTGTGTTSTTGGGTGPRRYTVQSGDTLGGISEETGVPVERLQELNPGLDPQSLTVGQRIRLR